MAHGRIGDYARMKDRSDQTLVNDLRELIAALDARVPRLEGDGERDIAHDAQALRLAALKRIAELEQSASVPACDTVETSTLASPASPLEAPRSH